MSFSVVPFLSLITLCVQIGYPLWQSLHALFSKSSSSKTPEELNLELTQWTTYWVIYVTFSTFLESPLASILSYVPLYGEMKLAVFVWLVYTDFQGAAWLWYNVLAAPFKVADESITEFVETKLQMIMSFALGAHSTATSSGAVSSSQEKFNSARNAESVSKAAPNKASAAPTPSTK